jgi:hypothetical protein
MTQIGEAAMIGLITEHTSKCELCTDPKTPPKKKSNADANWEEDPGAAIGNSSGDLEDAMTAPPYRDPRPKDWKISGTVAKTTFNDHLVVPNPHHLIPGNESLKQSNVLDWIFESDKITADVGYDVNNAENGVWLPSNNGMRGNPKWGNQDVKKWYVLNAMDEAEGHFHDRHGDPYSKTVTKILNKIADRMNGVKILNMDCPYNNKKAKNSDKFEPPFYLYVRLNGVSARCKKHLTHTAKQQRFLYTSKLVKLYWDAKKTKHLQG